MTTKYFHRTSTGLLKATLTPRAMSTITSQVPGKWRPYKVEGKAESVCYEVTDDVKYDMRDLLGLELFFWTGDLIIPVD